MENCYDNTAVRQRKESPFPAIKKPVPQGQAYLLQKLACFITDKPQWEEDPNSSSFLRSQEIDRKFQECLNRKKPQGKRKNLFSMDIERPKLRKSIIARAFKPKPFISSTPMHLPPKRLFSDSEDSVGFSPISSDKNTEPLLAINEGGDNVEHLPLQNVVKETRNPPVRKNINSPRRRDSSETAILSKQTEKSLENNVIKDKSCQKQESSVEREIEDCNNGRKSDNSDKHDVSATKKTPNLTNVTIRRGTWARDRGRDSSERKSPLLSKTRRNVSLVKESSKHSNTSVIVLDSSPEEPELQLTEEIDIKSDYSVDSDSGEIAGDSETSGDEDPEVRESGLSRKDSFHDVERHTPPQTNNLSAVKIDKNIDDNNFSAVTGCSSRRVVNRSVQISRELGTNVSKMSKNMSVQTEDHVPENDILPLTISPKKTAKISRNAENSWRSCSTAVNRSVQISRELGANVSIMSKNMSIQTEDHVPENNIVSLTISPKRTAENFRNAENSYRSCSTVVNRSVQISRELGANMSIKSKNMSIQTEDHVPENDILPLTISQKRRAEVSRYVENTTPIKSQKVVETNTEVFIDGHKDISVMSHNRSVQTVETSPTQQIKVIVEKCMSPVVAKSASGIGSLQMQSDTGRVLRKRNRNSRNKTNILNLEYDEPSGSTSKSILKRNKKNGKASVKTAKSPFLKARTTPKRKLTNKAVSPIRNVGSSDDDEPTDLTNNEGSPSKRRKKFQSESTKSPVSDSGGNGPLAIEEHLETTLAETTNLLKGDNFTLKRMALNEAISKLKIMKNNSSSVFRVPVKETVSIRAGTSAVAKRGSGETTKSDVSSGVFDQGNEEFVNSVYNKLFESLPPGNIGMDISHDFSDDDDTVVEPLSVHQPWRIEDGVLPTRSSLKGLRLDFASSKSECSTASNSRPSSRRVSFAPNCEMNGKKATPIQTRKSLKKRRTSIKRYSRKSRIRKSNVKALEENTDASNGVVLDEEYGQKISNIKILRVESLSDCCENDQAESLGTGEMNKEYSNLSLNNKAEQDAPHPLGTNDGEDGEFRPEVDANFSSNESEEESGEFYVPKVNETLVSTKRDTEKSRNVPTETIDVKEHTNNRQLERDQKDSANNTDTKGEMQTRTGSSPRKSIENSSNNVTADFHEGLGPHQLQVEEDASNKTERKSTGRKNLKVGILVKESDDKKAEEESRGNRSLPRRNSRSRQAKNISESKVVPDGPLGNKEDQNAEVSSTSTKFAEVPVGDAQIKETISSRVFTPKDGSAADTPIDSFAGENTVSSGTEQLAISMNDSIQELTSQKSGKSSSLQPDSNSNKIGSASEPKNIERNEVISKNVVVNGIETNTPNNKADLDSLEVTNAPNRLLDATTCETSGTVKETPQLGTAQLSGKNVKKGRGRPTKQKQPFKLRDEIDASSTADKDGDRGEPAEHGHEITIENVENPECDTGFKVPPPKAKRGRKRKEQIAAADPNLEASSHTDVGRDEPADHGHEITIENAGNPKCDTAFKVPPPKAKRGRKKKEQIAPADPNLEASNDTGGLRRSTRERKCVERKNVIIIETEQPKLYHQLVKSMEKCTTSAGNASNATIRTNKTKSNTTRKPRARKTSTMKTNTPAAVERLVAPAAEDNPVIHSEEARVQDNVSGALRVITDDPPVSCLVSDEHLPTSSGLLPSPVAEDGLQSTGNEHQVDEHVNPNVNMLGREMEQPCDNNSTFSRQPAETNIREPNTDSGLDSGVGSLMRTSSFTRPLSTYRRANGTLSQQHNKKVSVMLASIPRETNPAELTDSRRESTSTVGDSSEVTVMDGGSTSKLRWAYHRYDFRDLGQISIADGASFPTEGVSTVIMKIAPAGLKRLQFSKTDLLIFYVFEGTVIVRVGRKRSTFTKGGSFVVPRETKYSILNESSENVAELIMIRSSVSNVDPT